MMRRGEGDTESLAEMLDMVFRSGDAGECGFKALDCASPCKPLADRLPHMPPPLMPMQSSPL